MKLEGSHKIAAPRGVVWRALTDPAVLQRSIPGCEMLEATGENTYRATLKAGVGSIQGKFAGEVSLTDIVEEKSFTLTARAKAPVGFVEGKGKVALEVSGKETLVKFSGDVKTGGMLAAVGGRLIEAAAQKNLNEMFENLARECEKR
ncbi:MAG: carbon monoxide dehydrogenase subunit G [Acidobacteria bacterium]|nr:carbon monoxide dehydrogenase subunit G [Acidobacteriota bacterium]